MKLSGKIEIEAFKSLCVGIATGARRDDSEYSKRRAAVMAQESLRLMLPGFVLHCRTAEEFWSFISQVSGYKARRERLKADFAPILDYLEGISPVTGTAATSPSSTPQELLTACERYRVIDQIGEGAAGNVYRVTDSDGKTFAAKCLKAEAVSRERQRRFKNELRFCLMHRHPNILCIEDHGVFTAPGIVRPFYVMREYPTTLRGLISGGIAIDRAMDLFGRMLDGVEEAHRLGIWHRDLKPENILCDPTTGEVVVADFGAAHITPDLQLTTVETVPGSRLANIRYAAPEQRDPRGVVDHRADVFALGLILHELATGQVPHGRGAAAIGALHPTYAYLDEVVDGMLQQNPEGRTATVTEVKRRLVGNKAKFVILERTATLDAQVVPAELASDPLIDRPVAVKQVDYADGVLAFLLTARPSDGWLEEFRNLHNYESVAGREPRRFAFGGAVARIDSGESEAPQIVKYFKAWLPAVNAAYRARVESQARRKEAEARHQLEAEREEEARRLRVLRAIGEVE